MIKQTTDIYRPECGDRAEDMPSPDWRVPGEVPRHCHVVDRRPLCPVMTSAGYRPGECDGDGRARDGHGAQDPVG